MDEVMIPKPKKVAAGPNAPSILSTTPTPTAAILQRTKLLIAVALAPIPGHKSATRVVFIANMAFDVAAMINCRTRGTAIHPVFETRASWVGGRTVNP